MRQLDFMMDNAAGTSRTLARMAKQLREVCVTAMERLRQKEGRSIGGRRHFVVIDEKRKVTFYISLL